MNSKRRSASWLKPHAGKWQREQTAAETFAGSQDHFDALFVATKMDVLIDKTSKMVATVQNRSQFHGAQASSGETSTMNRLRT